LAKVTLNRLGGQSRDACQRGSPLENAGASSFVLCVRIVCAILISLTLAGCSTAPKFVEHDIPNFRLVSGDSCVYRGGQPKSPAAWAYLRSLGVTNIVKLNLESEVSDDGARALGMAVSYFPINELHQFLLRPNRHTVSNAVAAIKPGTFVHCMEGHDRTGLIIGCKRVWQDGWTKADAWKEMLADGLDLRLRGLIYFWDDGVQEQRSVNAQLAGATTLDPSTSKIRKDRKPAMPGS
jgi:hypothetical protein